MKRFPFALLVVFLLVVSALQAAAQYGDEPIRKFAFKIGVFMPSGSTFKDDTDSMWRCMGAEYALSSDTLERPTAIINGIACGSENNEVEASMLALQYEKRWYANKTGTSSAYYSAGVGYHLLKARTRDFSWENWSEETGGEFGLTAAAGYMFRESFFGELRYTKAGELSGGLDFSGISATIGMRVEF